MIGGIQTHVGGPGRIEEIEEAVWRRRKYKKGFFSNETLFQTNSNPITCACTNHIEALWAALRKDMPSHGVRINRMQEFIYSFLFFRNRKVDFSIFVSNVMKHSDEEYKAFGDEAFGSEEEEEEAGAEMLHEEESSESDYELETDTSSDGAGNGADAFE
ncbi:uncharacterized protein MONOS_12063 [Monocercomonoides exilis]|uniref:uncharacterized protein n=1 Tax=Monocercomonoides exilis TaxID=2049356 RepID=UPI00355A692A|nr:hypothetical protein MONOS_12063 [Monocercomonoides exilis]|eukprot:MONOS_12063.1-p1 / transcript=MONOS_12063.1 / gene=MONOS_12063 / organism=Monocercomonoides_exilis_PA203 / gene_product=unspecified product / transcript_product=unspecified product / location=Mono_scaffold00641:23728-24204(-) / protein_length=159 / sequence_SO=supercontig / SO=protein_coding / is_pseudo=false